MDIITKYISLETKGNTHVINVTEEIAALVDDTGLENGIVVICVQGSTAALTTIEFEPALVKDLEDFFEKIVPKNKPYAHDATWGDANGFSHIRSSAIGTSFTVPFVKGKMTLGTWQQIVLVDFDNRPRTRELVVQFLGK